MSVEIPVSVQGVAARNAKLSESRIEHELRVRKLASEAAGDGKYKGVSRSDIDRWMQEEASFYPKELDAAAVDCQILDEALASGADADVIDYVESLVEESTEQLHRDYSDVMEYAKAIDERYRDTEYETMIHDSLYGTEMPERETEAEHERDVEFEPLPEPESEPEVDEPTPGFRGRRYSGFGMRL